MLNTIEEAIEDIKAGKIVIVVDDEDRENEGDFLAAANKVTPEMINFMATHGRGLICAPLIEDRCEELELELMVGKNTAEYETPFTVSVDLIGHGIILFEVWKFIIRSNRVCSGLYNQLFQIIFTNKTNQSLQVFDILSLTLHLHDRTWFNIYRSTRKEYIKKIFC